MTLHHFKAYLYLVAGALSGTLNQFGVPTDMLLIYAVLLGFDFITGTLKAFLVSQVKPQSSKAIAGLISKVIMLCIPIVIALTLTTIGRDPETLVDVLIGILSLAETYSILGNVYAIRTGKVHEEWDAVSAIILGMKQQIRKRLQRWLEQD